MRLAGFMLLALLVGRSARAQETPVPLKPGAGAEAAGAQCNTCHTSDYIVMNSVFLSAADWKAEVSKMRTAFGATIDDGTAAEIAAYLTANYGSSH